MPLEQLFFLIYHLVLSVCIFELTRDSDEHPS